MPRGGAADSALRDAVAAAFSRVVPLAKDASRVLAGHYLNLLPGSISLRDVATALAKDYGIVGGASPEEAADALQAMAGGASSWLGWTRALRDNWADTGLRALDAADRWSRGAVEFRRALEATELAPGRLASAEEELRRKKQERKINLEQEQDLLRARPALITAANAAPPGASGNARREALRKNLADAAAKIRQIRDIDAEIDNLQQARTNLRRAQDPTIIQKARNILNAVATGARTVDQLRDLTARLGAQKARVAALNPPKAERGAWDAAMFGDDAFAEDAEAAEVRGFGVGGPRCGSCGRYVAMDGRCGCESGGRPLWRNARRKKGGAEVGGGPIGSILGLVGLGDGGAATVGGGPIGSILGMVGLGDGGAAKTGGGPIGSILGMVGLGAAESGGGPLSDIANMVGLGAAESGGGPLGDLADLIGMGAFDGTYGGGPLGDLANMIGLGPKPPAPRRRKAAKAAPAGGFGLSDLASIASSVTPAVGLARAAGLL